MKNYLISIVCLFAGIQCYAQGGFTPNDSINYFDQRDFWDHYYDSLLRSNYSNGITDRVPGYGKYIRWRTYWDSYMPSSGSYAEAYEIMRLSNEQLQKDHYDSYSGSGGSGSGGGTALIVNSPQWTELGPMNMTKIKTRKGTIGNYTWEDSHINNNGTNPPWDYNAGLLQSGAHVAKIDRLFQHPSIPNKIYALAGGIEHGGGGAFVSEDWGQTWKLLGKNNPGDLGTDQIPNAAVITFAIKPAAVAPSLGTEILFIGLSTGAVYRSEDDGVTWVECNYNGNHNYPFNFHPLQTGQYINNNSLPYVHLALNSSNSLVEKNRDMKFTKSSAVTNDYSRLVIARHLGVFACDNYDANITTTGGTVNNSMVWDNLTDGIGDNFNSIKAQIPNYATLPILDKVYHFTDFESVTKNGNTVYFVHMQYAEIGEEGDGDANVNTDTLGFIHQFVLTSNDFGVNWQFLGGISGTNTPQGEPVADNDKFSEANLEILNLEPRYLYVASTYVPGTSLYTLKRFDLDLLIWENEAQNGGYKYSPVGVKPHGFAIDPNDEEDWWFFTNKMHKMSSGVYTAPTFGYSTIHHADARDLLVLYDGTLLVATDGGVYRSQKGPNDHILNACSEGMNAAQSYNMALSQQPPFYVASGFWHCGFQIYNPDTDEWHHSTIQDGTSGHVFFLNNQRYTLGDQQFNISVVKDYDEHSRYFVDGLVASSENIDGRSYGTDRNLVSGIEYLAYNNNDFASNSLTNLGISNSLYSTEPLTIPNEPDLVAIKVNAPGDNRLDIYDGCEGVTPVPNLVKSIDIQDEYQTLGGAGDCGIGAVVFDHRRNGVHYIVLKANPVYSGTGLGRIAEYDPVNDVYNDLSHPVDGITTPSGNFPGWLFITGLEMDRETGILYLGTRYGVYYLDRAGQIWREYSENVPLFNTRLGIRHCTGELFASCTNRGIWYTDLIRNQNTTKLEWEIDQNETWTERMNLFCDLIVTTGNTLTIEDEVVVFGDQKIIVEPGAKLILDGGLITTECGNMWPGIEVHGDKDLTQNETNQGVVEIKDGGTIEYAINGITTIAKPDGNNDWQKTGGIVRCYEANFLNCRRGIEFLSYANTNSSGVESNNVSFIHNSTFITDDNMPTDVIPRVGISMFDVLGIDVKNSDFKNQSTNLANIPINKRGSGIFTIDATYDVIGSYYLGNGNPVPASANTFENLLYGVFTTGGASLSHVNVLDNDFKNCGYGVGLNGCNYGVVGRNDFEMPGADLTPPYTDPYTNEVWNYGFGIYSRGAYGFNFEQNDFVSLTASQPSDHTMGVYVNNSSAVSSGKVYRNRLVNNKVGNQTLQNNLALTIDCNDYTKGSYSVFDFYHAGGDLADQGASFAGGAGVKNTFNGACNGTTNLQLYQSPLANDFNYFYEQNTIDLNCVDLGMQPTLSSGAPNECPVLLRNRVTIRLDEYVVAQQTELNRTMGDIDSLEIELAKAKDPEPIEQEIAYLTRVKLNLMDDIVAAYADTNNIVDALNFLDTLDFLEAYMSAIPLSLKSDTSLTQGYLDKVDAHADDLENNDPDDPKINELRKFVEFYDLMKTARPRAGWYFDLDSAEVVQLKNIAASTYPIATNALSVLYALDSIIPVLEGVEATTGDGRYAGEALENSNESQQNSSKLLEASPNPTNGVIVFTVGTEEFAHCEIVINDSRGKEVGRVTVNARKSGFDFTGNQSGVYFAYLVCNSKVQDSAKIIYERK